MYHYRRTLKITHRNMATESSTYEVSAATNNNRNADAPQSWINYLLWAGNTMLQSCMGWLFQWYDDETRGINDYNQNNVTTDEIENLLKPDNRPENINKQNDDEHVSDQEATPDSTTFMCEICTEKKSCEYSFPILGCTHTYCSNCINTYIWFKLEDNIIEITCPVPGCVGLLEPNHCQPILSPQVYESWANAIYESKIQKIVCPYKDCSALLINQDINRVFTKFKCSICARLFCAQCDVIWHKGLKCNEYNKLKEEEEMMLMNLNRDEKEKEGIMLMKLAKKNKWMRCPHCKIYVQKLDGCNNVVCRLVNLEL